MLYEEENWTNQQCEIRRGTKGRVGPNAPCRQRQVRPPRASLPTAPTAGVKMQKDSTPERAPLHHLNSLLNEVECALGRSYLESRPRYMTIVLGNGCNIDCPHCYQLKNGDNLLRNSEIGAELRREFMGMYPYLSTLRVQGGEVFALKGFEDLVDDVGRTTSRSLISISTNGVLMDAAWAERIVSTPFQTVTVSFDGGTRETFERLRRGAKFDTVMGNIRRIQALKKRRGSLVSQLRCILCRHAIEFPGNPAIPAPPPIIGNLRSNISNDAGG
jgi:sulfatase maturation enzyme AslB (radical SAM superfamily)